VPRAPAALFAGHHAQACRRKSAANLTEAIRRGAVARPLPFPRRPALAGMIFFTYQSGCRNCREPKQSVESRRGRSPTALPSPASRRAPPGGSPRRCELSKIFFPPECQSGGGIPRRDAQWTDSRLFPAVGEQATGNGGSYQVGEAIVPGSDPNPVAHSALGGGCCPTPRKAADRNCIRRSPVTSGPLCWNKNR
jgi:hypothetical protein